MKGRRASLKKRVRTGHVSRQPDLKSSTTRKSCKQQSIILTLSRGNLEITMEHHGVDQYCAKRRKSLKLANDV